MKEEGIIFGNIYELYSLENIRKITNYPVYFLTHTFRDAESWKYCPKFEKLKKLLKFAILYH